MLHRLFLFFTLLLITNTLSLAQVPLEKSGTRSHYTYIYRLTPDQAEQVHRKGARVVNASWFHSPVDSFEVKTGYNKMLPQGHYLFMHANGPDLQYTLHTYSSLSTKLLHVKPVLAVLVHDSLGNSITDAEVRLNSRKATYDAATQTYSLKNAPRESLLTVTSNGFTLYEELERIKEYRSGRSRAGKIVWSFPIRYLWRPFYDVYKSFSWQGPQGWVRSVFSIFDESYRRSGDYKYSGYLVMNKPMFRPGDTVRYKAFVVTRNGKPVKGNALLQLKGTGSEVKNLGEVQPYRDGAFEGFFILTDSLMLTLDRNYTLALLKPGKRRTQYRTGLFRYEDYELKENTFTFTLAKQEHQTGQENSLVLRGASASGLNLMDARVEIIVTTRQVKETSDPVVFVPDTLWVHQQALNAAGETTIALPEKIFPKASVDYTVTAALVDASNERHSLSRQASYRYALGRLHISLLQDSLLVQYLEGTVSKPLLAELTAFDADYNDLLSHKLQLPARVPLSAYAAGYTATSGTLRHHLDLEKEKAQLSLSAARENDSLQFALQNPRRLPYWYFVYRGEKQESSGQGAEQEYYGQYKVKGKQPYFVVVQYLWAGKVHSLKEDAPHLRYLLSMKLEAPQVVNPGQKTDMKVAVKDGKGKPVAGVDLTAYALTSRFTDQRLPAIPTWDRYKRQRPLRRFDKDEVSLSGKKLMDWTYWSRRMGLDSISYYNFLYPKQGLFMAYTTTHDSITQVSPFVVDSGRVVPVHVVFLDEVPVYFSQTDVLPTYTFAADSGYHTVRLRTHNKVITLDSVYLKHRHKLVLSADITRPASPYAQAADKKYLTGQERRNLNRYLFYVHHTPGDAAYLQQGNRIHLLSNSMATRNKYRHNQQRRLLVGPFSPNWMQYVQLNSFRTNFMMEPDYSYHFEPNLLKMREAKLPDKKMYLPAWNKKRSILPAIAEEALTERKIKEEWDAVQFEFFLGKLYEHNLNKFNFPGTGRLGWNLDDSIGQPVRLVLLHKAGHPDSLQVYPREQNLLQNLVPGQYTLMLSFLNGDYVSRTLEVKPGGQTQVHFKDTEVKAAAVESKKLLELVQRRVQNLRQDEKRRAFEEYQRLLSRMHINFSMSTGSGTYNHQVTGVVTDSRDGFPIPGVTVLLEGTNIGVLTDYNGHFSLYVPASGKLVFRFIGYEEVEEEIGGRTSIQVKMPVSSNELQEVVVVGYGTNSRKEVTSAIAQVLVGKMAGVNVRGTTSFMKNRAQESAEEPLVIVDGIPYSGSLSDLSPETIVSRTRLEGEQATALYGAAGAAGVIIITTKKGETLARSDAQPQDGSSIRNNFSDYALWQPRLTTNKQGEAGFRVTFPDDITSWNAYVVGMDNKKHSGIVSTGINSFNAMMATLHLPRFLVEGDKAYVVGRAANYLPDSALVTTTFAVGGKLQKEERKLLNRSITDTLQITAPALAPDSLEVLYSLRQENGYTDGERRFVSIYPKGVEETTGHFLPLHTDTTFTLAFDPAKGPVKLHAQGDLLQVMLDEIDYLHKYEYWCSEQAASKLKALLLEKRIRGQLGQSFTHDRMVRRLIRHLEKTQLPEGAWTWWQHGPAYPWITNHVLEALRMAQTEKYPVKHQEKQSVAYLVYQLEQGSSFNKLTVLETLHQLQADVDYQRYVQELEKNRKPSLEEQFRLTRMRQRLGMPVQLDTLQKYRKQSMLGGLYWGINKSSLFNSSISNTLLAYQILRAPGNHERELAQIRAYLLSERRTGHWRNTYESARILETLLPDLLQNKAGTLEVTGSQLAFSGALNFETRKPLTDTAFAATRPLTVKKQGGAPLYLTAYQTTWNRTPAPVAKDFTVTTSLNGAAGKATLTAGKPVELRVEVEAKADADYVLLEVPIPAGCSYDTKTGKGPYEVHREYFRHKVAIFCDRLPKGKHTYTIQLQPRYSGSYILNPAKAELMYFPAFYGRTGVKQVEVK